MISAASNDLASAPWGAWPSGGTDALGQDAFLRLLVTQIQMQDPLEPMAAGDFVAQLAEFSTVEQLQTANLQLAFLQQAEATSQALLLIGKQISTGEEGVTGVVEAVSFADGQPKLIVGDQEVDPAEVIRVW